MAEAHSITTIVLDPVVETSASNNINNEALWSCLALGLDESVANLKLRVAEALRSRVVDTHILKALKLTIFTLTRREVEKCKLELLESKRSDRGDLTVEQVLLLVSFAFEGRVAFVMVERTRSASARSTGPATSPESTRLVLYCAPGESLETTRARVEFCLVLHSSKDQNLAGRFSLFRHAARGNGSGGYKWTLQQADENNPALINLASRHNEAVARTRKADLEAQIACWKRVDSEVPEAAQTELKQMQLDWPALFVVAAPSVSPPALSSSPSSSAWSDLLSDIVLPVAGDEPSIVAPDESPRPMNLSAWVQNLPPFTHASNGSEYRSQIEPLKRINWTSTEFRLHPSPRGLLTSAQSNLAAFWYGPTRPLQLHAFVLLPDVSDDLRSANAFPDDIRPYARSLVLSAGQVSTMSRRVLPEHAILGTAIESNAPVAFYVQLLADTQHAAWIGSTSSVSSAEDCRREFEVKWKAFVHSLLRDDDSSCEDDVDVELEARLLGMPDGGDSSDDLIGPSMWFLRDSRAVAEARTGERGRGEIEMRLHRCDVAFKNVGQLSRLMQQFRCWLEVEAIERARSGQKPMLLCRLAEETRFHPVTGELLSDCVVQHVINFQAYQPGHLLSLPWHHPPGTLVPLQPWQSPSRRNAPAARVRCVQATLISMPHVCLPSIITLAKPLASDPDVQSECYECGDDPTRPLESSDFASLPRGLRFHTSAVITSLDTMLADLDERSPSAQPSALLPLSQQATNCVRHILGQHLALLRFSFDLRLCERADEFPCVRGFVRLTGTDIDRLCPCCNRGCDDAAVARKWDTAHVGANGRKERLVSFLLSRQKLQLYCAAKGSSSLRVFRLTKQQAALLTCTLRLGVGVASDVPFGASGIVAPLDANPDLAAAAAAAAAFRGKKRRLSIDETDCAWKADHGLSLKPDEQHKLQQYEYKQASPAVQALLDAGNMRNFGWKSTEVMPQDFVPRHLEPERHTPTFLTCCIGEDKPDRIPSFEEEIEDETQQQCRRETEWDERVEKEMKESRAYVEHRFGAANVCYLDQPRLAQSAHDRDVLISKMLQPGVTFLKANMGGGKTWLLDRCVEEFFRRNKKALTELRKRMHSTGRVLWVSCKRMYGIATQVRLRALSKRLKEKYGIDVDFHLYMDERFRKPSASEATSSKQKKKKDAKISEKKRTAEAAATTEQSLRKRAKGETGVVAPELNPESQPHEPAVQMHLGDQQAVICSIESIERLATEKSNPNVPAQQYELVILDEIEEIRSNFHCNETMGDRRMRVFQHLGAILRQATYIWAADADLDVTPQNSGGIRFMETMLTRPDHHELPPFRLIWNTYRSIKRRYISHPNGREGEQSCITALVRSLCAGRNVLVVTNSREKAKYLSHHCRNHPALQALFAAGDISSTLLTGDMPLEDKQRFMQDKGLWRVQLLIYTPLITSGVDYSVDEGMRPWFHEAFLFAISHSSTARQTFQQLNRVRQLIDNRVHVHLDISNAAAVDGEDDSSSSTTSAPPLTFDEVVASTNAQLERVRGFNDHGRLMVEQRDFDAASLKSIVNVTMGNYNAIYVMNKLEQNRSRHLFEQLLKQAMVAAGGEIYRLTYGVSAKEQERMKADRETVKQNELERIVRAPDWDAEMVREQQMAMSRGKPAIAGFHQAVAKFHFKELYGLAPADVTVEMLQKYGSRTVMRRFRNLCEQAKGGSGTIHAALVDRVQSQADAAEHCLPVAIANLNTHLLLAAAGFTKDVLPATPLTVPMSTLAPAAPAVGSVAMVDDAAPRRRSAPVKGTVVGVPVGDLFSERAVLVTDIENRLSPSEASHKYWWPRLLRVHAFEQAIIARKRKNKDSYERQKNKLVKDGATATELTSHASLLKFEKDVHPDAWSGEMKYRVLLDALRSLLKQLYGITVILGHGRSGPTLKLDHTLWTPFEGQLQPSRTRFHVPGWLTADAGIEVAAVSAAPTMATAVNLPTATTEATVALAVEDVVMVDAPAAAAAAAATAPHEHMMEVEP